MTTQTESIETQTLPNPVISIIILTLTHGRKKNKKPIPALQTTKKSVPTYIFLITSLYPKRFDTTTTRRHAREPDNYTKANGERSRNGQCETRGTREKKRKLQTKRMQKGKSKRGKTTRTKRKKRNKAQRKRRKKKKGKIERKGEWKGDEAQWERESIFESNHQEKEQIILMTSMHVRTLSLSSWMSGFFLNFFFKKISFRKNKHVHISWPRYRNAL